MKTNAGGSVQNRSAADVQAKGTTLQHHTLKCALLVEVFRIAIVNDGT